MKGFLTRTILFALTLTGCSSVDSKDSDAETAQSIVAQGCANFQAYNFDQGAITDFKEATRLDEKYRKLYLALISIHADTDLLKKIDYASDEAQTIARQMQNNLNTINSFC